MVFNPNAVRTDPASLQNNVNGAQVGGHRNLFTNGAMDVWQRGSTSINCAAATRTYVPDRWTVLSAVGIMPAIRADSFVPGGSSRWSLQVTGVSTGTTCRISQRIESGNSADIRGNKMTFSAQVQNLTGAAFTPRLYVNTPTAVDNFASVNNQISAALQSCPAGSVVGDGVVTRVSFTFDVADFTTVTTGAALGLEIQFEVPTGFLDAATKNFRITEMQLELGDVVTPFENIHFAIEMARCLRYYQKSFPYATTPAQNTAAFRGAAFYTVHTAAVFTDGVRIYWNGPMRANPTMTFFNPAAANALWRNRGVVADSAAVTTASAETDETGVNITNAQVAGDTVSSAIYVHWQADAEL